MANRLVKNMKIKLPGSTKNFITLSGSLLALIGFFAFWLTFLLIHLDLIPHTPYTGLVLFMILPVPVVIGLVLIPLGMALKKRQKSKDDVKSLPFPVFDFNRASHRNAALVFIFGSVFVGMFLILSGYQGFHYSESVDFCGKLCHEVMEPEYVTYSNSPHARVACVNCHVGPGSDFYAKAKVSGLYQVYATLFNKYPRPIETPLKNLRPAREVCEQCHWPGKLFPAREKRYYHYLTEEDNAFWPIHLLIEIGGGSENLNQKPGAHRHVHPEIKIEYIAADEKRLEIPWIRLTYLTTGKQSIFKTEESEIDETKLEKYEIRTMDCIDCHNRPSHVFKPPIEAVNEALFLGTISTSLPEIKTISLELLSAQYSDTDSALTVINDGLQNYYNENYPEVATNKKEDIIKAVEKLKTIYSNNYFPKIKARWENYPIHKGHFHFPGCYRCHDGKHTAEDESAITNECNVCHLILVQGDEQTILKSRGLEFRHPVDIDEEWKETNCHECHAPETEQGN